MKNMMKLLIFFLFVCIQKTYCFLDYTADYLLDCTKKHSDEEL